MKKFNHGQRFIVLGLLLWLFCLSGLWAQQEQEYISTGNIAIFNQSLTLLAAENWLTLSRISETRLYPYRMILAQYEENSNLPLDGQIPQNESSTELTQLLNDQMMSLLSLEMRWQALEEQSRRLSSDNRELMRLMLDCRETIRQLRTNLECALERVQDAEDGAIAIFNENDEMLKQARLVMANITRLQQELAKAQRGSIISFAFGGVSFGVGAPLFVAGIVNDNSTMMWSGAGVMLGGGAIWALGHFLFNLW
jgi:hypothetical protein